MQCSPQELREKLLRHLDNDYNVSYGQSLECFTCFLIAIVWCQTVHGLLSVFSYVTRAIFRFQSFAVFVYISLYRYYTSGNEYR